MLSNTNKAGIRQSVKNWSTRKNISDDVIDDFIEIALNKANQALRIPPLEEAVTIDAAGGYLALPANFIEVKSLSQADGEKTVWGKPLERKSHEEVSFIIENSSSGIDACYFARTGTNLRVGPLPTDGTPFQLYYYKALPPLTADSSVNWFTEYAPEVLLYGAMAELCSYTRDEEGEMRWKSKFDETVNRLQAVEDRAEWAGSTIAISLGGSTR